LGNDCVGKRTKRLSVNTGGAAIERESAFREYDPPDKHLFIVAFFALHATQFFYRERKPVRPDIDGRRLDPSSSTVGSLHTARPSTELKFPNTLNDVHEAFPVRVRVA
jgi:hypothetical protein